MEEKDLEEKRNSIHEFEYSDATNTLKFAITDTMARVDTNSIRSIKIRLFDQTWGSGALGFGGMGTSAMTLSYTCVNRFGNRHFVYFGSRFAYEIENPNDLFFEDMNKGYMKSVADSHLYKSCE